MSRRRVDVVRSRGWESIKDLSHSLHQSGTFTQDFRAEFDADTGQLLRRQFVWFAGVTVVGGLLLCVFDIASHYAAPAIAQEVLPNSELATSAPSFPIAAILATVAFALAHVGAIVSARRGQIGKAGVERLTFALVVFDAAIQILVRKLEVTPEVGWGVWGMMWTHLLAAIFLPWTTWQAIRTVGVVWLFYAVLTLAMGDAAMEVKALSIGFTPLLGVPGSLVAWAKHSRRYEAYKLNFFQKRYADVRRELVDARRIHEALFPPARSSANLSFRYEYEPMRQIGGDYLYANWFGPSADKDRTLSVVLMDVTGHGIPAALTVNRLHGELERVFAEDPEIQPGEVLRLLNRYVHLTLATHSVFVTALCLKVDTRRGTIDYASGGHPPAFLRTVDGRIHELPSTTFVLGAAAAGEFDSDQQSLQFGPGDALIAYTDGAIEARDRTGKMMGVKGIQKLVAFGRPDPDRGWSGTVRQTVESHRYGPPADDTLVVEITRSLQD
jgi:serine phosphatase RsbU (regulator of sigma subunit)